MNSHAPYSTAAIKKFTNTVLRARLASDFVPYHGGRDLVRQRFNFVQLLALNGGRYGDTLKILPTFYVVGARPSDEVMPQSVALHIKHPNRWRFQGRLLDEEFADEICKLLSEQSPLSFFAPIGVADVVAALTIAAKRADSEDAPLFLAFFMMTNGISGSEAWIERARKVFLATNATIVHDWQRKTLLRIEELERRCNVPDAENVCKDEAQCQAARLRLPKIDWLTAQNE